MPSDLFSILLAIPRNTVTAVGVPLVLGMLSGSPTKSVIQGSWYKSLYLPPGNPPKRSFPIVWSVMYAAMGYASHLAVNAYDVTTASAERASIATAIKLYYVQLGLNFAWTTLFFVKKQVGFTLIDSVLITTTSCYMTALLHEPTDGKTTVFLAPYCAWLLFATYLNGGIWWLNRGRKVYTDGAAASRDI